MPFIVFRWGAQCKPAVGVRAFGWFMTAAATNRHPATMNGNYVRLKGQRGRARRAANACHDVLGSELAASHTLRIDSLLIRTQPCTRRRGDVTDLSIKPQRHVVGMPVLTLNRVSKMRIMIIKLFADRVFRLVYTHS